MTIGSDVLSDALEKARSVRHSSEVTGPSVIYVVDTRGYVQPIKIP